MLTTFHQKGGPGGGTGSVRQQDGQRSIGQNVSGCPAKYHLSQSALCVGALDQKVATQRFCRRQDCLTGVSVTKLDRQRLGRNAITLKTSVPPVTVSTVTRSARWRSGIARAVARACSVLQFHATNTLVAICRDGDGKDSRIGRPLSNRAVSIALLCRG